MAIPEEIETRLFINGEVRLVTQFRTLLIVHWVVCRIIERKDVRHHQSGYTQACC
jgi:hypothetical protein